MLEIKVFSHESHVLVHAYRITIIKFDFDVLLTNRLDESNLAKAFLKAGNNSKRGGGLA